MYELNVGCTKVAWQDVRFREKYECLGDAEILSTGGQQFEQFL
jgi:hypothetical protein